MARRALPLPWTFIGVASDAEVFNPGTPWAEITSSSVKARATYEIAAEYGDMKLVPAYQVANSEGDTPTTYLLGGFESTNGNKYPTGWSDISSNLAGKQIIRWGWVARNVQTADTTRSGMRVGGKVEVEEG